MNFDQLLIKTNEENPCLALLGLATLKGRRVIATGPIAEGLLIMVPDILFFEKRDLSDVEIFKGLNSDDLLIVESSHVDDLWKIAGSTQATILHLSDHGFDESISDLSLQEKDLRSAILSLSRFVKDLRSLSNSEHLSSPKTCKALFLDRDGVVIKDVGYANSADQVLLMDGIVDLLADARLKGYKIFIVTNQSGIARGLVSYEQYDEVNAKMMELLAQENMYIDQVVKATYFPKPLKSLQLLQRSLRKPRPGMISSLIEEQRIDLKKSIMIGDSARDLMAASIAGVQRLILLNANSVSEQSLAWKQWPLLSRALVGSTFLEIKDLSQLKL